MYREGRVNLKKAKALIAEEKAYREEDKKRSKNFDKIPPIEVGGKGCTALVADSVPDSYGSSL